MVNSFDFIKRLEYLLEYYDLNASAFADKIQVQRSNISHLMSGRNKPSLEFVLKVVKQFPEVNLYWLLNGKGTFPSEPSNDSASDERDANRNDSSEKNVARSPPPKTSSETESGSMEFPAAETLSKRTEGVVSGKEASKSSRNPEKTIKRIVIFYANGSFESFSNR